MAGQLQVVKDLPQALQSPFRIYEARDRVDLVQAQPFVLTPEVKTFQLEVSVCPRADIHLQYLTFETSLNCFEVSTDASGKLHYPLRENIPEGSSTAGLKLATDNSTSPNSQLGDHARVSWTITPEKVSWKTAAVLLALSTSHIDYIRMIYLTLYQTEVDPRTHQLRRTGRITNAALQEPFIRERCNGATSGTVVLTALARSSAWWHLHVPVAYSAESTGVGFSERICKPIQSGQRAMITGQLEWVKAQGGFAYPETRNITVAVAAARNLPVASVLEKLTCGYRGTWLRPSVRVIEPKLERTKKSREYAPCRVSRGGEMALTEAERVPVAVCAYNVLASDTRVLRFTMYTGSQSEVARTARVAGSAADMQGGVEGDAQWADIKLSELWRLLPERSMDGRSSSGGHSSSEQQVLVEVRLRKGEKDDSQTAPGVMVLHVSIKSNFVG